MTDKASNRSGYSIPRSYKPVLYQTITVVFTSDALLLFSLLLIIGLRNALGIDAELIGLTIVLFGLKTILNVYGVYTMLRNWLGVTYFVMNNKLYVQSEVSNIPSSIYNLTDVSRITADQKYKATKKQDYGSIVISFIRSSSQKDIKLTGVKDPEIVANRLSGESK